jgi:hypothetical protein
VSDLLLERYVLKKRKVFGAFPRRRVLALTGANPQGRCNGHTKKFTTPWKKVGSVKAISRLMGFYHEYCGLVGSSSIFLFPLPRALYETAIARLGSVKKSGVYEVSALN